MPAPKILLAKSPSNTKSVLFTETLVGHTQSVCQMADLISQQLTHSIADMFSISSTELDYWRESVWIAAWLHDWGKANSHFQKMLLNYKFLQGVRHETLSLVLAMELNEWLYPLWKEMPRWSMVAALFATSGHHLKFPDPNEDNRTGTKVIAYLGHHDFRTLLKLGQNRYNLPEMTSLKDINYSLLNSGNLKKKLHQYQRQLVDNFDDYQKALIASIKTTVMAADLAGSALPNKITDPENWLQQRLGSVLTEKMLLKVVGDKLKGKKTRPFQNQISESDSNTILVEAGCGSGKTVGAYQWASRRANGKRLFFCYPTTGTATEGFSGYLFDPDFNAMLVHSRAKADYCLLDNMPHLSHEENDLRMAKLEALETWPIPAVVCTAHTVLGLLENVRRGLYAWPSLVRGVFVFDEVHAYSNRLFSYLLRFLEVFANTPVLMMTATLPPSRKEAIKKVCQKRGGLVIIPGPQEREEAKRYFMGVANTYQDIWVDVTQKLREDKKVLWVCNTVPTAQKIAEEAQQLGLPVKLYHSRYRYIDRLKHHRAVIDGFTPEKPAMLSVTTQVAEMSLDLSADLLITEWAPIAAMIQRLGRLNRSREIPLTYGQAIFIKPKNKAPYTFNNKKEEQQLWDGIETWLQILCDGTPKSQKDLAETFIKITENQVNIINPISYCSWLDKPWESLKNQQSIEEAGYTLEVIREEDLGKEPTHYAIPMPFPPKEYNWKHWPHQGRYIIAPAGTINYDFFKGATWRRN